MLSCKSDKARAVPASVHDKIFFDCHFRKSVQKNLNIKKARTVVQAFLVTSFL